MILNAKIKEILNDLATSSGEGGFTDEHAEWVWEQILAAAPVQAQEPVDESGVDWKRLGYKSEVDFLNVKLNAAHANIKAHQAVLADRDAQLAATMHPVAVPDGDAPGYKPQNGEKIFYSRLGLSDDGLPFMSDSSVSGPWDIAMVFEKGSNRPSKFFSMHDYLAAPAAQGDSQELTDDEIHDIMSTHVNCDFKDGLSFARAVIDAIAAKAAS